MVHLYHITFQWNNKVHLKIICDFIVFYFIFYQHVKIFSQLNLSHGYIFSLFLKFRQSQPQYSFKKDSYKKVRKESVLTLCPLKESNLL